MTHEKIMRVQNAHVELAKALGELRDNNLPPKLARAVSLAITHAETSYLWFRSAVQDYTDEGHPR